MLYDEKDATEAYQIGAYDCQGGFKYGTLLNRDWTPELKESYRAGYDACRRVQWMKRLKTVG